MVPFYKGISHIPFAEFGIDKKRLVVIKALPSSADFIKCLELADIYLYLNSIQRGACSLAEALLVGLPVVVRKGQTTHSDQFLAVEELLLPELVANSEKSYVELSTALGTNPELRRHDRD